VEAMGPFTIDLMASGAYTQRIRGSRTALPFFSRYDCEGSAGIGFFALIVSLQPGSGGRAFACSVSPRQ